MHPTTMNLECSLDMSSCIMVMRVTWYKDKLRRSTGRADCIYSRLDGGSPGRNTWNVVGLIHDSKLRVVSCVVLL